MLQRENRRLEKSSEAFWAREIVVKIEYKYCPNLTIIDTPGLIAAPPGRRNSSLQHQARQVESLVKAKMEQKEYIMLCLEDSSDWSNATTRSLVMKVGREKNGSFKSLILVEDGHLKGFIFNNVVCRWTLISLAQ